MWQQLIDRQAVQAIVAPPPAPPVIEQPAEQPRREPQHPQRALTVGEAALRALELSEGMDQDLRQQLLRQLLGPHQPQ